MTDKAAVLAQLARVVATEGSQQPLPVRLCLASMFILGAEGAAITLSYTDAARLTVCATDEVSARLEDLQDVLGEGPGPDAYRTGRIVRAELGQDESRRWPTFAESALTAVGPAAISALPIRPGMDVLGVLTVYQLPARPLEREPAVAQFLADAVGAAMLRDGGLQDDGGGGAPWLARAQVDQATGMVVAQLGVSPEDAVALLRAHAYADNASMATIAAEIIERRLDFSLPDESAEDDSRGGDPRHRRMGEGGSMGGASMGEGTDGSGTDESP